MLHSQQSCTFPICRRALQTKNWRTSLEGINPLPQSSFALFSLSSKLTVVVVRCADLSLFAFVTFASLEDAVGVLSAQAQELFRARDEIIVLSLPASPRKAPVSNESPANNRLYIAPIPANATQEDVRKVFERWGAIDWVHLGRPSTENPSDSAGTPKTHAFVTFATLESARAARESIGNDWLATDDAKEAVSVLGVRTRAWYAARVEGDDVKSKQSRRRKSHNK
ncbi:hypothetical protein CYLTODRAFT_419337 [Cylindrobasidium torrendii FP15055 ss-10]|uniref:RRM domain-containing protein n=1 Tax=Cylindrobasidium torrendii FP15055 ss-10 TaxID=1314674 RepID=A0A0D7BL38_9AGAR|nr:hypothetical protein CYLTODRAFT_419337 [Cylindrobasidium torrendii FP15055 ss-10]